MEHFEEVITYHREALSLRPPGHPNRSASLSYLAGAIFARYLQFGNLKNLEEGITYYREALSLRPPGHPDRSTSLKNLACAVLTCYEQCQKPPLRLLLNCHVITESSLLPHDATYYSNPLAVEAT